MEILKLVLIDDDPNGIEVLKKILGKSNNLEILLSSTDPILALEFIKKNPVDLIITDIVMDSMHGIHLASILEKMNIPVIICSAYESYAYDGYQVNAIAFIKKPANAASLFKAIEKLNPTQKQNSTEFRNFFPNSLIINEHGSATISRIRHDNIYFLRTDGNYVEIITTGKNYMVFMSLTVIMQKLPQSDFYRVHRSYAINLKKILKIKAEKIYLEGGHEVTIGSSYYKDFFSIFKDLPINKNPQTI